MSKVRFLLDKLSESGTTLDDFDLKAVAKSLTDFCKSELGVSAKITTKAESGRRGAYLEVSSDDISSQTKIKLFKSLTIGSGTTGVSDEVLQVNLQYNFTSFSGGNNSLDIGVLWFNRDGSIKEKRIK